MMTSPSKKAVKPNDVRRDEPLAVERSARAQRRVTGRALTEAEILRMGAVRSAASESAVEFSDVRSDPDAS